MLAREMIGGSFWRVVRISRNTEKKKSQKEDSKVGSVWRGGAHSNIPWAWFSYTATAIPFLYSFSGNSAASALISTFMCLWAIYIFTGSVYIFPLAEQADPSWEYIIRPQTQNVEIGTEAPIFLFWEYVFVSNFRHFVFAVYDTLSTCRWRWWVRGGGRGTVTGLRSTGKNYPHH